MKKLYITSLLIVLFFGLKAADFTSVSSGNWGTSATWSVVGVDADGIPDLNDNVTIITGHTITQNLGTATCHNLSTDAGSSFGISGVIQVTGNLTKSGTFTGSASFYFYGPSSTITINSSYTNSGNWNFMNGAGYSIVTPSCVISKQNYIYVNNTSTITNLGNINLWGGAVTVYGTGRWINGVGSSLNVSRNLSSGSYDFTAIPNTLAFSSAYYNTIPSNTYYNLILNSLTASTSGTKTFSGNITVLNDFSFGNFITVNCNNFNINLGGNWTNTANTNCTNMATVNFNGAGTQTITRSTTEKFKNVTLSGTGTVRLARDVNATGTTTLTSGTLDPSTFSYHQKGASWLGNGGLCNTVSTGKIVFDGGIAQTIGGTVSTTFGNVEINNPGFSVTLTTSQTGAGTTTLTSGILDPGGFVWNQSGASWMANGGTLNTAAAGKITFNGAIAQTIDGTVGATFGNLEIFSTDVVSLARNLFVSGTLTITGGTLDISPTFYDVNLSGDFVHNGGTFVEGKGTVYFDGAAAQTVSGPVPTTFYNITSNKTAAGVVVSGTIIINNILLVNSFSFGSSGSDNIILTATGPNSYGFIAELGGTASLTGTGWVIDSYINGPATAYWQYLGSPVTATTVGDWDGDPRFYMSGVSGNDGNACCPTFYSVRTYNEPTNTYSNVTSTGTSLVPGRGYMVWMGDNMVSLTAPLTFDSKGTPNQGTVLRAVTAGGAGGGYNLVSNPFACPVIYADVVATSGNLGASFLILNESGGYDTDPNGGLIAPAQGFLCVATASGNMKFPESAKTTASNPAILRNANPENFLTIVSGNATNGLGGSAVVNFLNDAHNGYDMNYDMPFIASPYDDATNIWSSDKDGKDLLLNALNGTEDMLDIPLTVVAGTPGNQLLTFKGINSFTSYSCAWIEDIATGEKIDLKNRDTYSFMADAVGEKHNFNLHFERTGSCPLSEQNISASLDASSLVFVNNGNILVKFEFDEKTDVMVSVFNAIGQEVSAPKNINVSKETISLDHPAAHGVYLVRIAKGDEVITKKIYY